MSKYESAAYYAIRTSETVEVGFPQYVKSVHLVDGVVKVKLTQRWRKAFLFTELGDARMTKSLLHENSEGKHFDVVGVSVLIDVDV